VCSRASLGRAAGTRVSRPGPIASRCTLVGPPTYLRNPFVDLYAGPAGRSAFTCAARRPRLSMTALQRVVEPERSSSFTSAALDADATHGLSADHVTFAEQGGKRRQIMRARVIRTAPKPAPYIKGHGGRMDAEPGAPGRIPGKGLTPNKEMPGCLPRGFRNRTKVPGIARFGGLRQTGALRNTSWKRA